MIQRTTIWVCACICFLSFNNANAQKPAQTTHKIDVSSSQQMQYLLYLPKDYESDANKDFPIMLFLHGGGETGDDIELVKKNGPPKLIEDGKQFPFIVVSPQNPKNLLWDDAALLVLLNEVIAAHRVDESRVYLTGLSRGGFGAWRMAIQNPEKFAAVVPICGGGFPVYAPRLKEVPIWAFHGAKDDVVPLSNSANMVEAMKNAGGNVKLTIYPNAGHDSWTQAYSDPELYEWLAKQSLEIE